MYIAIGSLLHNFEDSSLVVPCVVGRAAGFEVASAMALVGTTESLLLASRTIVCVVVRASEVVQIVSRDLACCDVSKGCKLFENSNLTFCPATVGDEIVVMVFDLSPILILGYSGSEFSLGLSCFSVTLGIASVTGIDKGSR